MYDYESLKEQYQLAFPDWHLEDIEKYALKMSEKYSHIKKEPNAIHLDYYGGLVSDEDIRNIESKLQNSGLVLSRFDKNGVPYASATDFMLQIAIFISHPIIVSILEGAASNAVIDAIKYSAITVWRNVKIRGGELKTISTKSTPDQPNFGLNIKNKKGNIVSLELDSNLSEEATLKALDKVELMLKQILENDKKVFYVSNKNGEFDEIDINRMRLKRFEEHQKKNKPKKK